MGKINKFQYGYKVPTRTWGDIGNFLNKGAEFALKVFEPVGKAVSSVVSNLPAGGASAVLPLLSPKNFLLSKLRLKIFEEKVGPALSPTNHAIAWTQGSLNPKVGLQKLAEWGPLALLGSFVTDAAAFKYVPKVPGAVSRTKAGKSYLISKEIDKATKGPINLHELSNLFIEPHVTNPKDPLLKEIHPWELSNSEYSRFLQPNGKIRLQLNSHTEAKPRQFVLDPQGDNKYYVHMRVWDDADKKVPATMSSADKNTLYEALYNELPEGGEILFPKSGPGNYGTRGTVAGLQHLSRNTGFTPGTPGTLQYLDKDGKTVRTYNGTSFIKNKVSREILFMDPLPDLPPKTMPYVEAARKFKENNIKFRALEARNYATSLRRRALDRLLNWEAHNMGFLNEGENLQFVMPHNKLPKVKIYDEQIPGEDFGVNGSYDDRFNTVNLTGVSSQGLTPYHEYLHYYGIGASPVIYLTKLGRAYYNVLPNGLIGKSLGPTSELVIGTLGVLKRSDAYRTYKLGNVLDPDEWNLLSDKEKTYIGSEELPVHALTTGKDLGIKPFLKYPGDLEMISIANKARSKNPWLRVVKNKTSKDLKNFWKLLTGSYLAVQPFMLNEKE